MTAHLTPDEFDALNLDFLDDEEGLAGWVREQTAKRRKGGRVHRADIYQQRKRYWLCVQCRRMHEGSRPAQCDERHCLAPGQGMLRCDSWVETQRFLKLWSDVDYGLITGLRHHPVYPLYVPNPNGGPPIQFAYYEADADYFRGNVKHVEDTKPKNPKAWDPIFRLKRRAFEAQYAMQIGIVHR